MLELTLSMDGLDPNTNDEQTIEYTVSLKGTEDDHRDFRQLIYESEAEMRLETLSGSTEEGRPLYLQNLIDDAVQVFEEKDHEPIDAVMEVVHPEVSKLSFEIGDKNRTIFDMIQQLRELNNLKTTESRLVSNSTGDLSEFNHIRNFYFPDDLDAPQVDSDILERNENEWAEATLKAILHLSLEDYVLQEVKSLKDIDY